MTIIVYDSLDWNSFINVTDMDVIADAYLNADQWTTLSADDKDRYLATSCRNIVALPGIVIPTVADTTTDCLPGLQAGWIMKDLQYSLSVSVATGQEVKSEKVGPLEVSYYESEAGATTTSPIPAGYNACLQILGYSTQSELGIGSIRKVR